MCCWQEDVWTHTGEAGLVKAGWEHWRCAQQMVGTGFAGDFKHCSHEHSVTGFWGDNSGLTDLSVQKLQCVVSG